MQRWMRQEGVGLGGVAADVVNLWQETELVKVQVSNVQSLKAAQMVVHKQKEGRMMVAYTDLLYMTE